MSTTFGVHLSARRLRTLLGEWEIGASVYRSLADRIRLLIIDGRIPVASRLPSERELASELARSRSTIVAAYDVLRLEGYASSLQGSGTLTKLPPRSDSVSDEPFIDFAHAAPAPIAGLSDLMKLALVNVSHALGGPVFDMLGDAALRAQIAARYSSRGVATKPEQIMVTVGAQHAISLLAHGILQRSDRVLVESPSYPHAHDAFRSAGAQLVTTPVTWDGWDCDHLIAMMERSRPAVTYLMPDFQNPTGASMSPGERERVVSAAARVRSVLVIDETTADLSIDRAWDDGPMAKYAEEWSHDVVTVGSLSKSMWGGLRIGWIRAEISTIENLIRARPAFNLGTPQLEQLVATELISQFHELLPVRTSELMLGRDFLAGQLADRFPEWEVPRVQGGLSLWVGLGAPVSSSLALLSRARGLLVSAGPKFAVDGSQERFMRLPFTTPVDDLARGVGVLAEAWSSLGDLGSYDIASTAPSVI